MLAPVSKAFTKDDRPDEPVVVRHRPSLPDGSVNYVTARGLAALRAELTATEAGDPRRAELEQRIASAVLAPPARTPTPRIRATFPG